MNAQAPSYKNLSIALIGFGVTGKACAKYLLSKGAILSVFDKSFDGSDIKLDDAFKTQVSEQIKNLTFLPLHEESSLITYDKVVVSPGVNLQQAFLREYFLLTQRRDFIERRVSEPLDGLLNDLPNDQKNDKCASAKELLGDIELFAREINYQNTLPNRQTDIIAVTGSNGKSTVVQMIYEAFNNAGIKTGLGGNIGTSALSLLDDDYQVIVLELSSFQLETIYSLSPKIACLLNLSSDHLDRHGTLKAYQIAKQRIYLGAEVAIYNRDDDQTIPLVSTKFGLSVGKVGKERKVNAGKGDFYHTSKGIYRTAAKAEQTKNDCLIFDLQKIAGRPYNQVENRAGNNISNLKSISESQLYNMQFVFACAEIYSLNFDSIAHSLSQFAGLPHRFQVIKNSQRTIWINDSKATNPGACVAAIDSLRQHVNYIVLIAGGDAKGADLSQVEQSIRTHVDYLIVIGKDGKLFAPFAKSYEQVNSIEDAVNIAYEHVSQVLANEANHPATNTANKNKLGILLSPACASIDMFANYAQRGDLFTNAVLSKVAA